MDTCIVNVYQSGKVSYGGKVTSLRQQVEEWCNLQQAAAAQQPIEGSTSRATRYVVNPNKFDRIRNALAKIPAKISWQEEDPNNVQVYRADIQADGERVVVTQYKTNTLLVQGRLSPLFDQVCHLLDEKLVQSTAERTTRYIPEEQRDATLAEMNQPEAEVEAWKWLEARLDPAIVQFLDKYDQDTLLSGAMLLQAVKSASLSLPDYSPLVMPFARAYEGFLIKLFMHIGLADSKKIKQNVGAITVGAWLDQVLNLIVDTRRHGHIVSTLKSAWESTRHLMIHSDPIRQTKITDLTTAEEKEICGSLIRAFEWGYKCFVAEPIQLKPDMALPSNKENKSAKSTQPAKKKENSIELTISDEATLLARLKAEGYTVEVYDDPTKHNKWRVTTDEWKIFCPREPGDKIIVRGAAPQKFVTWYEQKPKVSTAKSTAPTPSISPHIGVDEAGKGDYFGPLAAAAVYVDQESAIDLIRWGVKDSKSISDSKISELALKIRERCPNAVRILLPPEYNQAYQRQQNLNQLLAELHTDVIGKLVTQTGCHAVLADQFAAPEILAKVIERYDPSIKLEQRTKGEADIAVAAASILAREGFVATIEDYRIKAEMEIPLGSSSPKVVEVGQAILRKWGRKGLERIAKIDFRTTQKILSNKSK